MGKYVIKTMCECECGDMSLFQMIPLTGNRMSCEYDFTVTSSKNIDIYAAVELGTDVLPYMGW